MGMDNGYEQHENFPIQLPSQRAKGGDHVTIALRESRKLNVIAIGEAVKYSLSMIRVLHICNFRNRMCRSLVSGRPEN